MSSPKFAVFLRAYEFIERAIVILLLIPLMAVVLWSAVALGIAITTTMIARFTTGAPMENSAVAEVLSRMSLLHDVFGGFLLILIGVELMKTVVMYLSSHELHVEVVFTVAMIAIARHAIDLNLHEISGFEMLGMASLVVTLAVAFYLFRRTMQLTVPGERRAGEVEGRARDDRGL